MNPAQLNDNNNFIPLKKATQTLGVSIETLLEWNELNILKPTITQSGEIGYLSQQITHFVALRKSFHNQALSQNKPQVKNANYENSIQNIPLQNNLSEKYINPNATKADNIKSDKKTKVKGIKLVSISFISFLVFIGTALLIFPITGNSTVNNKEQNSYKNLTSKSLLNTPSSSEDVSKSLIKSITLLPKEETFQENKVDKLSIAGNESTNKSSLYEGFLSSDKKEGQDNTLSPLDSNLIDNIIDISTTNNPIMENLTFPLFSSRPAIDSSTTDMDQGASFLDNEEVFLATNFGVPVRSDQTISKSFNWVFLIVFSSSIIFLTIYHFNNLSTVSAVPNNQNNTVHNNFVINPLVEKVFELDQKTDGTVVVTYQNMQYKISKPELNSETDQLIQRLLELINEDKEIKYDIIKDERLNLNTPLSKVVTRLGFVGIKRDLFFPRTSKNKVIFRKYVTKNDLALMNIIKEDILKEISNSN